MTNETIHLHRENGQWLSTDNNPQTFELFGTHTLPTCFTAVAPAEQVLATIQRLNPTATITINRSGE